MDLAEWDIEFLDRTESLYPRIYPEPVSADMPKNKELPNLVPTLTYRFGFIGRMFDIVRTKY